MEVTYIVSGILLLMLVAAIIYLLATRKTRKRKPGT
jgi:hypothetical protein